MSYRALARSVPSYFLPLGLLARLPYAMTPLGTLLLLRHATGSATFAGLAAGAQSVAIAAGGLAAGGLAARFGARRLGMITAVLNALAAVGLVLATQRTTMLLAAVLVGLTQPNVGLLVRVHWSAALGRTGLVRTAFAYESAVDELSFVLGPVVVGLLAELPARESGPLLGMVVLLLAAAVPFAAGYGHGARPRGTPTGERLPLRAMGFLAAGMGAVGAVFGSVQTVTAAQVGTGAGYLYALLGLGSVVSGFAYAWLPVAFGPRARYLVFAAALVVGTLVLKLGQHVQLLPLGMAMAGFALAPYMITLFALTDTVAPAARLPVAMGVLGAGGPVGTAVGQAVTGHLVDTAGLGVAWLVPVGCAGVGLLLAVSGQAVVVGEHDRGGAVA